jgi:hypothetical protein
MLCALAPRHSVEKQGRYPLLLRFSIHPVAVTVAWTVVIG